MNPVPHVSLQCVGHGARSRDRTYHVYDGFVGGGSPFTAMHAEEIFRQFFGDRDLGSMFGQEFAASAPHQVRVYTHRLMGAVHCLSTCNGGLCAILIGASLSEPHTSVTSLHPCVCMFACLLAWTDHLP